MQLYLQSVRNGHDGIECWVSDDGKTVEVRTTAAYRISRRDFCFAFRHGSTEAYLHKHLVSIVDLGSLVEAIHEELTSHHRNTDWEIAYGSHYMRVKSDDRFSDTTIKSINHSVASRLFVPAVA